MLVTAKNKQRTTTMYTPKHKQESTPQSAFEMAPQPYEALEIPGLVPDDELTNTDIDAAFEHSIDTSIDAQVEPHVESAGDALPFEIPELVPDDEYVPPTQPESTSPGVLGFSVPRRSTRQPARLSRRENSTMYAYGKQRGEQIQEALDFAREREAQKEQSRAAYELSRQAMSRTVGRPIDIAKR